MKTWWKLALFLLAACAVGLLVWAHLPRPGVTWENIAKLRSGMTESEVEDLLGGAGTQVGNRELEKSWQNEQPMEGSVVVRFGRTGTVIDIRANPPPGAHLPRWRRWIFGEP
jgi:hypothetical protein